ncbi:MAG: DUF4388 domain-containing protein, partial [Polyangiales bacterium]
MDPAAPDADLATAASLARALLALSQAQATGVLEVHAVERWASLAIVAGTPRAALMYPAAGDRIGEILHASGDVQAAHCAAALAADTAGAPLGSVLVRQGVLTPQAVVYALRQQLRARVQRMFAWPKSALHFRAGSADMGLDLLLEPVPVAELVLGALRASMQAQPLARLQVALPTEACTLSALGERLLQRATLWPEESAALYLLRHAVSPQGVILALSGSPRALRFVAALQQLSALVPEREARAALPLLLRKRRQLRQAASAQALLDLRPDDAPEAGRRQLRRLAAQLHPDR